MNVWFRDYSASELGWIDAFNPATAFIDAFASIGWAYDLKKASVDMVKKRQTRCGDVHYKHKSRFMENLTGSFVLALPIWALFLIRLNVWLLILVAVVCYLIENHPNGFSRKQKVV